MIEFSIKENTLGGTELPTSSGRCDVTRAGSGTVLGDVGCCIDTGISENDIRALNSSRRLNDERGDDKVFVVVVDVLADLINDVLGGGVDRIGVPTNVVDVVEQNLDWGKPLAESTPKGKKKKKNIKWSDQEKEWLYECYLTVYKPGHRTGYIEGTIDMYKLRMGNAGYPTRSVTSVRNQLQQVKEGVGLTEWKIDEIRQKVKAEQLDWLGETWVDGAMWNGNGRDDRLASVEEDKEIDFSVDELGVIKTRAGRRQVRGMLDGPKLNTTPSVEVQKAVPGPQDERDRQDGNIEQEFVFNGQKLDIKPNVVIAGVRVDTWKDADGSIRDLNTEEKEVLELLRKVCDNGKWEEVPNLRAADKKKVAKEVSLVDGVMHNLLWQGMRVTEVNRLLYAGGAVVALRMGLKLGGKKRGQAAQKPRWQRRIDS